MKLEQPEFERLALEQLDLLYRVARRLTHDPTTAEDLVQETYLRAFRARSTFELQAFGIRPWLLRIMRNLQMNRSQRESRQPQAMEDDQLDMAGKNRGSSTPPPAHPSDFQNMDERLVKALNELPEEYQVVMLLWAVDELSYKEIAESLEIPIGTVMSRLHRARGRLSAQLHGFAVEEGIIRE